MTIFKPSNKLDNVSIVDGAITKDIESRLASFGGEVIQLVRSAKGNVPVEVGDGTFWSPADLAGIYFAIMRELKSSHKNIIQVAGGLSPLLYAVWKLNPCLNLHLVGIDKESYYEEKFNNIPGLGYELKCMDATDVGALYDGPSIVFSYHFLDYGYIGWSHLNDNQGKKTIGKFISAFADSAPSGSVMVTQVESTYRVADGLFIPTREYVLDSLANAQALDGFVWTLLNGQKTLRNEAILFRDPNKPESIAAHVMISKVK